MEKDALNSGLKIVVIGGSAGSLEVLMQILPSLPLITSLAIVIVLHRKSGEDTTLEELIALKSVTPVMETEDKVRLLPGYIYVAPSDYHLLFEKDQSLSLDTSEKINYSRPSIDVAFELAAEAYGPKVTGILLSGANADGTKGLQSIKNNGGLVVVQQPETAEMDFMPRHAIENVSPDYVLGIDGILDLIMKLNA